MRRWWAVLMGLALVTPVVAGTVAIAPGGTTLASSQAGTGRSATVVDVKTGYNSMVLVYCVAGGTATVQTELSCDKGTTWVVVANSAKAIDSGATACDSVGITFPQCWYATNVTAATGTVTTKAYPGTGTGR